MIEEQPYDGRHGYTFDPSFVMPTATEPPRDPAMPRPIDEARQQRETERREELVKDRRAKALELAVRAEVPTVTGATLRTILETADIFLGYIETGAVPA